jgi:hypothetical protein
MASVMDNDKRQKAEVAHLLEQVDDFRATNAASCLATFCSNNYPKFNLTTAETKNLNLSCTAICTYTLTQYSDFWSERSVRLDEKLRSPSAYWSYLINGLLTKDRNETLDEFSVLNVLCVLKRIQTHLHNKYYIEDVIRVIKALSDEFEQNRFVFTGNPHPIIYYKFLNILSDWREELIESKAISAEKISLQLNILQNAGKYELYRQIALYNADDKDLFDTIRLYYSFCIVRKHRNYSNEALVEYATRILFQNQLHTGLLPFGHIADNDFILSDGKIIQQEVLSASVISTFECLNDALSDDDVRNDLKKYYKNFKLTFDWASVRLRRAKDGQALGWYSEYNSLHSPESYVTAHILLFLKNYSLMLSEILGKKTPNLQKKHTIFISYSHKDSQRVANYLYDNLKKNGYSVFYDKVELEIGDELVEKLANNIDESEYFVMLMSPMYFKSGWCRKEMIQVLTKEAEAHRSIILPVMVKNVEVPSALLSKLYIKYNNRKPMGCVEAIIKKIEDDHRTV